MLDQKLLTLLEVYEKKSFSKASRSLAITQPAVSQHIKALEEEFGVKIFDRSNSKFIVTKEGEMIIQTARKMLGMYNLLLQDLSDRKELVEHLIIGVTHTVESNPIAESLARFCSENDGISIKIITDSIKNLYKQLRSYELDMIIVEGRTQEEGLKFFMLDTDYLCLAVSPDHPFANRELITLRELKSENLILRLPNSGTRNLFVSHLESNNMNINEFNVILELDNVATIKDLIRRNFGVSILPRSACLDEIKKGKIIVLPIENLSMIRDMNIVYRSDFVQTDILRGIVKAYNETLRLYK
ncbi:MAG: LysR family transcriptional regulator [Clostridia bacterium]|nr:LysR family transcriptional regulator [Clostridia bacterium]